MNNTDTTAQKEHKVIGRPFPKGVSGNPAGRPKGSISIKDRIRQILEDEPDTFEEVVRYYIKDKRMRDLLWRMLEGQPAGSAPQQNVSLVVPILGGVTKQIIEGTNEDERTDTEIQ